VNWNETPAELERAWAEQPVIIPGPDGELYGIFTPPAPEVSPTGLCVILLGRNRWWVDRLSVKGARWLAARGFACLRFDYHGCGESEGICEAIDTERPFSEDVAAAIRFMHNEYAQRRFVLSGFCFDARTALAAVEHQGAAIEAIAAVAAPPGDKLTHLTMSKVGTFLRMPISVKKIALNQALRRRLHRFLPRLISHPERAISSDGGFTPLRSISDNFRRDVHAIIRCGVRCLFLIGSYDAESFNFKLIERSLLAKLDPERRALFTLETWPTKVHVPHDPQLQRMVMERVVSWIDALRQTPFHQASTDAPIAAPAMTNGRTTGSGRYQISVLQDSRSLAETGFQQSRTNSQICDYVRTGSSKTNS
jgi:alpha/beta superfamily hydrolase